MLHTSTSADGRRALGKKKKKKSKLPGLKINSPLVRYKDKILIPGCRNNATVLQARHKNRTRTTS